MCIKKCSYRVRIPPYFIVEIPIGGSINHGMKTPPFSTGATFFAGPSTVHVTTTGFLPPDLKSHQVTLVVAGPGGFQGLAKRQLFETFQGTWEKIWPKFSGSSTPTICEVPSSLANLVQIYVQFHYGLWYL